MSIPEKAEAKGPKRQDQLKRKPEIQPVLVEEQVSLPRIDSGVLGAAGDPNNLDQPSLLNDVRFSAAQRQSMASQIGRVSGNQYLQRVIVSNRPHAQAPGRTGMQAQGPPPVARMESSETREHAAGRRPGEATNVLDDSSLGKESQAKAALTTEPLPADEGARGKILIPGYTNSLARYQPLSQQRPMDVLQPFFLQRVPRGEIVRQLSSKLPLIQSSARAVDSYYTLMNTYAGLTVATTDLLTTKLQIFSINYDMAYSRYSRVIGEARAEAQNQTLWRGIFLGIATGVLAGLAAAYIAPSTAAGWLTLTLADAATAAGSSFLQGAFSAGVAYALSDAITVRGSDLQPGGLSPDMLRTQIWQQMANLYRGAAGLHGVMANLHRNSVALERLTAEVRVHIAGGSSEYTPEDILQAANTMSGRVSGMLSIFTQMNQKSDELRNFSQSVGSFEPNRPTVDQMERDIWVMWMGTLSDEDSDILDLDAVEDHLKSIGLLGPSGSLGVDFGDWTSEEDELAALNAARPRANRIRQEYENATARWQTPEAPAGPGAPPALPGGGGPPAGQ